MRCITTVVVDVGTSMAITVGASVVVAGIEETAAMKGASVDAVGIEEVTEVEKVAIEAGEEVVDHEEVGVGEVRFQHNNC